VRLLNSLARKAHDIVCVLASPLENNPRVADLWRAAPNLGIECWPAKHCKDPGFADVLRDKEVDLLISFRSLYIVDEAVIAAPNIGAFNLHSGPLPEYAGRDVISWAIVNGETHHGVTLHWMARDVDAGAIAFEQRFEIDRADTALSVTGKAMRAGVDVIHRLVDTAAEDSSSIPRRDQDLSMRHYYPHEPPYGGRIVWREPGKRLVDFVRASYFYPFESPWGTPMAKYGNAQIGILQTRLPARVNLQSGAPGRVMTIDDRVHVAAGDDWILLDSVLVDGKVRPAGQIVRHGESLGDG
jgi:methionyl-tRNA formyltransferase